MVSECPWAGPETASPRAFEAGAGLRPTNWRRVPGREVAFAALLGRRLQELVGNRLTCECFEERQQLGLFFRGQK